MFSPEVLDILRCPSCHCTALSIGGGRRPELVCNDCKASYPFVDGILDMMPVERTPQPGQYRTDTLLDVIAGTYNLAAPLMSLTIWRTSPLRWVDMENRALGRANHGIYLRAPMTTGIVLDRVLAPYHDVRIVGIDSSWKMLRKARKNLAGFPQEIALIRADLACLPVATDSMVSVHSVNGLHSYQDRRGSLQELIRVGKEGAWVSGSALIRGQEPIADIVLDRYEKWGVFPMLRTPEFLVRGLEEAGFQNIQFETHGAALFFTALVPSQAHLTQEVGT